MATPYITPAMLTSHPAGLAWNTVPSLTASTAEQAAQLGQVCWQATSAVDRYCRQPLRATVATETLRGPGEPRVSADRIRRTGLLITRRWPVTSVAAIQVSPADAFPSQWSAVPVGQWKIRHPVILDAAALPSSGPQGGNAIEVGPGYITWDRGRSGWDIMASYLPGWPHAGLTTPAAPVPSGTQTIAVDDVTGWAGTAGFIYDGVSTEIVEVTTVAATTPPALPGVGGTVQAGPGVLTLAQPLLFSHATGVVVSALPPDVIRASALQAAVMALETIDAIATESLAGQFAGGTGVLAEEVEMILDDYRRIA